MTGFLKKMFNKSDEGEKTEDLKSASDLSENLKNHKEEREVENSASARSVASGSAASGAAAPHPMTSSEGAKFNEAAFDVVKSFIEQMIQHADFRIDFALKEVSDGLEINFYGDDEELFTFRSGQVMDALQLLLKRAVDKNWPEDKIRFYIDTNNFKKNNQESILSTVKRLKDMAVEQNKPMYTKTYLPKDRKLIHQQFNDDADVRSRSVGEGLYKKVKIYPIQLYNESQ